MKSVFNIALNDLRVFFAERGNLISLVVLPLAFTLMLGWAFGGGGSSGPQRVRVDVVDQDNTAQSAQFLVELRTTNETLVLCPVDNDAEDFCRLGEDPFTLDRAIERARGQVTRALIVLPAGYGDALLNFGRADIQYYATGDLTLPNAVRQSVDAVLQKVNTASLTAGATGALFDDLGEQTGLGGIIAGVRDPLVQSIYAEAQRRVEERPEAVRYVLSRGEAADENIDEGFGQSVPGMGSMYVMFTVLGGIAVLMRERRQWTLQRLVALPLSRAQILGGKVLTYFTLGMIQYLIVFGVGLVMGLDFGDRPLVLLPVMIAFVLCITGLAFAIAPNITNESQASGISLLLSLSLAPLGGAWWPLDIVPDFMRTVAYLSPISWAMTAFHDVMWYNRGFVDVLPEIGVLLGAAAVLFAIGVSRFRYV
ncbi:ABC transporter permease subunit [bacterium]|nr:ABC transporter permease subunit [bacterium]